MRSATVSLVREATLERLRRGKPALVSLVAPAGFGKSSLVEQYLGADFEAARCDCSGARDGRDLARRLMPQIAASLEDGSRPIAERLADALAAWQVDERPAIFLENVDSQGASSEFFAQLLTRRPPAQLLIASREPLPLRLTRFVALHEIVVLRAEDLAFDLRDIASTFSDDVDDSRAFERIFEVTRGWPIAISLLRRAASEGRLKHALDHLEEFLSQALGEYISGEVVSQWTQDEARAIFACAAIPRATSDEVLHVHPEGLDSGAIAEFAKESPFLDRDADDATYAVHPLIAAAVLEHQEQRRSGVVRRVATWHESRGDSERAAELFLADHDQAAAARALSKHDVLADSAPSATYRTVLAHLDHSLVQRHPVLWGVSALGRIYCANSEDLLDEAESLKRTLSPDASPTDAYFIFVFRVLLMAYLGRAREALAEVEGFMTLTNPQDGTPVHVMAQLLYFRGFLRARLGEIDAAEDDLNRSLPFTGELDVIASATLLSLAADVARVRGERAEWQFLERSLAHARNAALPNITALVIAQSLFSAWFEGDNAAMLDYALDLDPYVAGGVDSFAYLAHAAQGRAIEPTPRDMPEFVTYGRLIAISHMRDEQERQRFARSALAHARRVGMPFLKTLAAIAVAVCDEAEASEYFAQALSEAQSAGSPMLLAAVEAVVARRNDCGMLTAFVAQILRGRFEAQAPIRVDAAAGTVYVDGESVALGGRELELLVAISMRRAPTPRAQLAAMLWPDHDDDAARNALAVCLHRLRLRLRRKDAIEREGDGYRLHPNAEVDLWQLERMPTSLKASAPLSERDRTDLTALWEGMRAYRPHRTEGWEWFKSTARRISDARIVLAHRLAADALHGGDAQAALTYASDAIECDGCDEPAREIAIRAYLQVGDRAAALREYRQYRDVLREELAVEPSAALTALVL